MKSDLYLDVISKRGCWAGGGFGLTRKTTPQTAGDCAGEAYDAGLRFGIEYVGDACWASPAKRQRHAYFIISVFNKSGMSEGPQYLLADDYINSWSRYEIIVDRAGMAVFYIDGRELYRAEKPLHDSVLHQPQKVIIDGRSSGSAGYFYQDDIVLTECERLSPERHTR